MTTDYWRQRTYWLLQYWLMVTEYWLQNTDYWLHCLQTTRPTDSGSTDYWVQDSINCWLLIPMTIRQRGKNKSSHCLLFTADDCWRLLTVLSNDYWLLTNDYGILGTDYWLLVVDCNRLQPNARLQTAKEKMLTDLFFLTFLIQVPNFLFKVLISFWLLKIANNWRGRSLPIKLQGAAEDWP